MSSMPINQSGPEVLGPIEGSRPPWGVPRRDPEEFGYQVAEYQLRGVAACYEQTNVVSATSDGRIDVRELDTAPYHTRFLVIRPRDPMHFNHTVLLNWQNVSAGFEQSAPSDGEMYEGYAWVGVSAQEAGLHRLPLADSRNVRPRAQPLVEHDSERYGTLHHPGDPGSFDIFSDAARVLGPERSTAIDPLADLEVRHVVAVGGSQSAMRLVAYANALHLRHRVIDGFVLSVWEGRAPGLLEGPISLGGGRTTIRNDLATPMVVVNSEAETLPLYRTGAVDSEWIRFWEVAGVPHGVSRGAQPPDQRGRVANPLTYQPIFESALRHVRRWVSRGQVAPSFPRIEIEPGSPPHIRRDMYGNAVGGIRLPELEVPVAEYRGMAIGTGRGPLFGSSRPFPDDELRTMCPSRQIFDSRWQRAVDALVATEAIRPEDAAAMRERARGVTLPIDH
jgi:Alpha/beta hydrolase domain